MTMICCLSFIKKKKKKKKKEHFFFMNETFGLRLLQWLCGKLGIWGSE